MERLAQLLDDLDDFVAMVGLISEKIRNAALKILTTFVGLLLTLGGVLLALAHPPIALATAIMLFVTLLYRAVTSPRLEIAR